MSEPAETSESSSPAATRTPKPRRRLPWYKRVAFAVVAMALPFVLLGLIELGMRLSGWGGYPPAITRVGALPDGSTLYISDAPGPASFFFNNPKQPGSLIQQAFVMPKPAGRLRVITIGESAMQGFPQPPGLASSAFLEAMLRDAWSGREVEVLNLAVTAIASFPAQEILREALAYEPDAVVIYVGNNEFFGAYGVASLNRAGQTPTAMRWQREIRSLALVQGITRLIQPAPRSGALMEIMVGQSFTGVADPSRGAAEFALRTHLSEMVRACRARGVPVVLCTLPANERDLAPLGKPDTTGLSAAQIKQVEDTLQAWRVRVVNEPAAAAEAVEALKGAVAVAPKHAQAQYWLGRALLAAGKQDEARVALDEAINTDTMPWRPPESTQRAIRTVAEELKGPDLALADLRGAFRAASADGVVGWDLMDDHVHPSLRGQVLAARTIASAMARLAGPAAPPATAVEALAGDDVYLDRLGDNRFDRYAVAHAMRSLFNLAFFKETNPAAFDRFDRLCKDFEETLSPGAREIVQRWQDPNTHKGTKIPLGGMMGRQLIREQRWQQASQAYRVALRHVPAYTSLSLEYTLFMLDTLRRTRGPNAELTSDEKAIAEAAIARGVVLLGFSGGRSPSGHTERHMARLHQLLGRFEAAVPLLEAARSRLGGDDLVAADMALVESYLKLNRVDAARKLIQDGIQNSGRFSDRYRQMLGALPK